MLLQGIVAVGRGNGAISGRILKTDGMPAANVRVAALQVIDGPAVQTEGSLLSLTATDIDGRYRLENIPPGRYYIMGGPIDAPFYFPGVTGRPGATVVSISPGEVLSGRDFSFVVPKLLRVSGRVVSEDGAASSGTRRAVQLTGGQGPAPVASVAPDGSFEFLNVWPGAYDAIVLPRNTATNAATLLRIVLEDRDLAGLQVPIPALVTVRGTVTMQGGGIPPPLRLRFMAKTPNVGAGGGTFQNLVVTPNPDFALQLAPEEWTLTAEGLPAGYSIASMTRGATNLLWQPLRIAAGDTPDIAVTLAPPSVHVKVSGQIKVTTASAILPETLRLMAVKAPDVMRTSVEATGAFEFSKVVPGEYILDAGSFARTVIVNDVDMTGLEIEPPEAAAITGDFVKIPPGEFIMGCSQGDSECSDDERPPHRVKIAKGFEIGKYEVTWGQWRLVMGAHPWFTGADLSDGNLPVPINWNGAQEFINRVNARKDGYLYRLPSEAEWEYAARAGTTGPHPGGTLDDIAWHTDNSQRVTHPVGEKLPNAWGLHDVLGSVWEWTQDWYDPVYYAGSPVSDPSGPILYEASRGKVARGGGFNGNRTGTRSSHRRQASPGGAGPAVGFRLVRERIQ